MKCVISQPTFLPWIGWFDLTDQADIMVILDDVAFSKQSWQQRNRIRTPNGLEFLSLPVKTAGKLGQKISDCELANQIFVNKMLKTIHSNYVKAPFYANTINELTSIMQNPANTDRLVELNCALIKWFLYKLQITTPIIFASKLNANGDRGEHVASICEQVEANYYLSPAGAEDYLIEDIKAFDDKNISVWLHEYMHPEYRQRFEPFIPYASTLDLIFNTGHDAYEIMLSGRRPSRPLKR